MVKARDCIKKIVDDKKMALQIGALATIKKTTEAT
jgi:hypothetical protein